MKRVRQPELALELRRGTPDSASFRRTAATAKRAVLMLAAWFVVAVGAAPAQPNVLLIMADDMGFSDLGCYGGEISTPNLDSLAANGLRFTQFYNAARCCPTRASLLTGLYPHQAGLGHMTYENKLAGYRGELGQNCVTIAEALKPAGYRAYAVGKWHVALELDAQGPNHAWPLQRGFDRFYGTSRGGGGYWDPSPIIRNNKTVTVATDPEYQPETYFYTDAVSDNAVRFISDHARDFTNKPFFMYVAYSAPHWPLHAKEQDIVKYRGKYDGGYSQARQTRHERQKALGVVAKEWKLSEQAGDWNSVTNKAWEARCMEVYAAQIDCMDQGIGRILAALKKAGQFENTLILFLQDNGGCAEVMGRAGHTPRAHKPTLPPLPPEFCNGPSPPKQTRDGWPILGGTAVMPGPRDTFIAYGRAWANVSNTPFREYKHWVHEGGIATPLIAHWPASIKARGELRHQPAHLIDIMPTCLEVAATQYPTEARGTKIAPAEGRSLVPAFANKPVRRDALFWEHEGSRAVRSGRWKLVAKGPAGKWELYDIEADRTESRDLAARETAVVSALTSKWETWARRAQVLPWIWKPAYANDR